MSLVKHEQNNVTFIEGMPLLEYCKFISNSQLIPKNYQGKPADIFLAINMGKEIGLKPLQALKSISVINSTANIYGDAAISLVQAHPQFEDIKEYFDEKLQAAVCIIKRKNQSEHIVVYSIEDAKKAGLWGKPGPWQQYSRRMLQMRARGFALRDRFADALGGLILAEEAQDYPIDVTPKTRGLIEDDNNISSVQSKVQSINTKLDSLINEKLEESDTSSILEHERLELPNRKDNLADKEYKPFFTHKNVCNDLYINLLTLIGHYNISEELQKKWCDKAGVNHISELNDEQITKCIEFIKQKHTKDDINNTPETDIEVD